MVLDNEFLTIQGKINLNCKSFGIYGSLCTKYYSNYVGQTLSNFSNRWTSLEKIGIKVETKL